MSNTITLRPVPSHPTKSAMLLEPLDYLMLSDDNAARIDGVYIEGRTVAVTMTHLVSGETLTADFDIDEPVSHLPG